MRWKPTGEIFKEEGVISGIKYGHTLKRSRISLCFLWWDSLVALPVTFKSGFWAPDLDLQFPIRHFSVRGHKELKPSTPKTESVMFSISALKLFLFSGSSCQWMSPPYAYKTPGCHNILSLPLLHSSNSDIISMSFKSKHLLYLFSLRQVYPTGRDKNTEITQSFPSRRLEESQT